MRERLIADCLNRLLVGCVLILFAGCSKNHTSPQNTQGGSGGASAQVDAETAMGGRTGDDADGAAGGVVSDTNPDSSRAGAGTATATAIKDSGLDLRPDVPSIDVSTGTSTDTGIGRDTSTGVSTATLTTQATDTLTNTVTKSTQTVTATGETGRQTGVATGFALDAGTDGTGKATGTVTASSGAATITFVAVSTATCSKNDSSCRDDSGTLVSGCNNACGGLVGTCPGNNLTCYNSVFNMRPTTTQTTISTNDGPFGTCIAAKALNCTTVADCGCLPTRCSGSRSWYAACSAGKCWGSCE